MYDKELESIRVQMVLVTGYDEFSGNAFYRRQSFSGIESSVTPEQVMTTIEALASLQQHELDGVYQNEQYAIKTA